MFYDVAIIGAGVVGAAVFLLPQEAKAKHEAKVNKNAPIFFII